MTFVEKAWYNRAYISVSPVAGSEVELRSKTTTLNVSGGDFDIEGIETFGGKVTRVGTREDIEISFEGIPVSVQDFDWMFHGVSNTSTSITSWTEKKNRVTILWTNETGLTSAAQAIATSSEAYRQIYAEAYCTSVETAMDAGEELTATMSFKLATADETGGQNYKLQSCDTTSALAAVPAYTNTTKY